MARLTTSTVAIVADIAALRALDITATGQTVGDVVGVGSKERGVTLYMFVGPVSPTLPANDAASSSIQGWVKLRQR